MGDKAGGCDDTEREKGNRREEEILREGVEGEKKERDGKEKSYIAISRGPQ